MKITGHTHLFGVIGNPVRHSLSPLIHGLWLEQSNIDARYLAFPLDERANCEDLKSLHKFGVKGLNVTMPFKNEALAASTDASNRAKLIGAANTLKATKTGWYADNSDAEGFLNALKYATGNQSITNRKVLILGAGGAARAVAFALAQEGANLSIVNRTLSKAQTMADTLAPDARCYELIHVWDLMNECEIVVNATNIGFDNDNALKLPEGNGKLFFELSYGVAGKRVTDKAQAVGWKTEDGLRMLVEQAAISFELWHGIIPDTDAVFAMCKEELGR